MNFKFTEEEIEDMLATEHYAQEQGDSVIPPRLLLAIREQHPALARPYTFSLDWKAYEAAVA